MTLENEAGFIRMVARADNHLLLGIQGVGAGISELSASFSLAIEMGARLEDIAGTFLPTRRRARGFGNARTRHSDIRSTSNSGAARSGKSLARRNRIAARPAKRVAKNATPPAPTDLRGFDARLLDGAFACGLDVFCSLLLGCIVGLLG